MLAMQGKAETRYLKSGEQKNKGGHDSSFHV